MGVLATRSTFRPNPIGMSVVKLDKVELCNQEVILHISGMDLLDQTPVIDIKPYIPYCDAINEANAGFAQQEPQIDLYVKFAKQAQQALVIVENELPDITLLIEQVLSQDPRPAYKQNKIDDKVYGMTLYHLNIQWHMLDAQTVEVIAINASSKNDL